VSKPQWRIPPTTSDPHTSDILDYEIAGDNILSLPQLAVKLLGTVAVLLKHFNKYNY